MDIQATVGEPQSTETDALIIYLAETAETDVDDDSIMPLLPDVKAIDEALNGAITDLLTGGDFSGKANETVTLYPRGAVPAQRVILVGMGKLDDFSEDVARRVVASGLQRARTLQVKRASTVLVGVGAADKALDVTQSARAIAEGGLLGLYQYHGQKTSDAPDDLPQRLSVIASDDTLAATEAGLAIGRAYAEGAIMARNLVNLPPNYCTPNYLAQEALDMAKEVGLKGDALERHQMEALKMGALLAVAQGSDTPPRFIILEHNADKANDFDTLVLIGKGVTFDTGGYSLKTRDGMIGMKADMSGGAAVIGAMKTIAMLDVPLHVVGLVPAADNMINGKAYRPQDVITASNGTTIEIVSTDAEGRMLLADALVYAKRYDPAAVVNIATLTGAAVVALGDAAAALYGTDDTLRDQLVAAGDATYERVWPMPLFPEYAKALESTTADTKNSSRGGGGAGTAAWFLKNFVDYPAWAHVDMAGKMSASGDVPYIPKGDASGFGARLLAQWVQKRST